MMRIGVYYRVSTDKQDLASQVDAVERWISELPLQKKPKSIKIFKDEGISGKTLNRPGYQNLLKAA
ncbi:MAG: recombinase family protein, partial [Oligoflexales bacterium]|nr:recombinase family protein [Oligoflexales bacterium]